MNHDSLTFLSPLKGWCAGLDDSPDAVFRDRILGDGVSIDPTLGELHAPFDGEVLTVPDSRHAINLRADNGAEFLIHVGIDSVKMAGDGFVAHVVPGDRIQCGQLLLSFDLDKVVRAAASLRTPVLLLHSDRFELRKLHQRGPVEPGDELFEVWPIATDNELNEQMGSTSEETRIVAVGLQHGIHARPAAALITAIKKLDAKVLCQLGEQPEADASSAVALMSLGVSYGDKVRLTARGKDAAQALDAFEALLEPLPVDTHWKPSSETSMPAAEQAATATSPPADGTVIRAQVASPGLAMGRAFKLGTGDSFTAVNSGSVPEETRKLTDAVAKVRAHLHKTADTGQSTGAEIATAHLALLDDPLISTEAETSLSAGNSAASAWSGAVDKAVDTLRRVNDRRMLERVDDLLDINLRVQRALAGQDPGKGPEVPQACIILADNMLPSQLLELDRERVNGICLAAGGATSHVAILAISLNIPMLVAGGRSLLSIEDSSELLIDAELGELQVRPGEAPAAAFQSRLGEDLVRREAEQACAQEACRTTDGTRIHINANLASVQDALAAVEAGAEGCGLLRTEFAFMEKSQAPDTEQQLQIYSQISAVLGDKPMVVRTLDAGGDKPISYINMEAEENPALGVRGIRLSLQNKAMLETQLKAFLQLHRPQALQVMIPMVSSVHEVYAAREILERLAPSVDDHADLKLGVMIETPAAALIADRLAEIVDFFSIGTNDLTQYTLCMDRGEPALAAQLDTLHPAVLALIKNTVEAAVAADIPAAVCGGAAGDMLVAPVLLGLGVRELSMPASLIARQKARLRRVSMDDCTKLANAALAMKSAEDVRSMMREFVTS